jgi:SNF2 family DNA or RNA helicase
MNYEFKSKPFEHQERVFNETRDLEAFAVLWEQGVGKTKIAIDTACYLYETKKIDAVLIVASAGVHRNWVTDELPKHIPDRISNKVQTLVWETDKSKTKGFIAKAESLFDSSVFPWLTISYNSFVTDNAKKYLYCFLTQKRCFYVIDEAHNIKNYKALRTQSILKSSKYAPYRRVLTGTPVAQGCFDIYSQLMFLDNNFWKKHGFHSYSVFKSYFGEWFTRTDALHKTGYDPGYDKLLGYRNTSRLNAILATISSRETKESAGLNLPPKLYTRRYYELTAEQKRVYKELQQNYMSQLDNGSITEAELAITRLLRLQQIVCGYVSTDNEEPVQLIGEKNPRLDLLAEIVADLHTPTIIWARFTKDIDQIMALLGDSAVRYDGTLSADEAAENKRKFQEGEARFFVGNPQKGKEGLTFVHAKTVIYYSNSFKLLDRLQSEDRAHRIGQTDAVLYIDLIAPNTIDDKIVQSLRDKFDIANQITGDKLKEWL